MIWTTLYWILLTLAIIAALYALFWNRSGWRGRPKLRCRKCFYDLTATPGDLKSAPIQCPECGKNHHSYRSMRKAKRSKLWVGVALILLALSHTVIATPAVKQRGWLGAVPSWALIFTIHKTPKFIQDPSVEWYAVAYGHNTLVERAMRELHVRARVDGLSWLEYQLVAWSARTENEKLLCQSDRSRDEGVSPRASGYDILIEQGLRNGKLGDFHRNWYRKLFDVEVKTRSQWPEGARIYAELHTRVAYSTRAYNGEWAPGLRVRIDSGYKHSYTRMPHSPYWEVDPFPFGGIRNTRIYGSAEDELYGIRGKVWSDQKIDVSVSSKTGIGKIRVRIYEVTGYQGTPLDAEELLGTREIEFTTHRTGDIEDYVHLVDSDDVRSEIERCIEAESVYWFDMDGRWHAMLKLELVDQPVHLGNRRYTFGGSLRSLSANEELAGQAWWALEPDTLGGWKLIHEGEWVPMFGWADETIEDDRYPDLKNMSIRTNPNYCLRDNEASTVVSGRLRWKTRWKQVQIHPH